ncbi:hypothetical protein HZB02_02750 [Candidatus Woesearchaeota archaeon]|nr:hypothetical protein [Candidatus Woesearchaeota archaeon]
MEMKKTEYELLKNYLKERLKLPCQTIWAGSAAQPRIYSKFQVDDTSLKVKLANRLLVEEKSEYWKAFIEYFINLKVTSPEYCFKPEDLEQLRQPRPVELDEYEVEELQSRRKEYLQAHYLKGKVVKIFSSNAGNLDRIVTKNWSRITKVDVSTLEMSSSHLEIGNLVEVYASVEGMVSDGYGHMFQPEWRTAILLKNLEYDMHYKSSK